MFQNKKVRRALVHGLLALPLILLLGQWVVLLITNDARGAGLTADPLAFTINRLGLWAIRILLLTLAITPVRMLFRWQEIAAYRRAAGLWAFAYAAIHFAVYFGIAQLALFDLLWDDVLKRRYILFGMGALLCLIPLTVTSTHGWIKRLGGKRWQSLHRLVYVIGILGCIHFILRVRGFQWEPWLYSIVLLLLLILRKRQLVNKVRSLFVN